MKPFTLGNLLCWLYATSKPYTHSQLCFFAELFSGYCQQMAQLYDSNTWQPNQSMVNKLMHNQLSLPWRLRQYYILDNSTHLQDDVKHYLCKVISTAMQREYYHTNLLTFVQECTNVHPEDKAYILQYADAAGEDALVELLYRTLRILLVYYPS